MLEILCTLHRVKVVELLKTYENEKSKEKYMTAIASMEWIGLKCHHENDCCSGRGSLLAVLRIEAKIDNN